MPPLVRHRIVGLGCAVNTNSSSRCFNGAADFHPRKQHLIRMADPDRHASMGPRTSIRGNETPPGPEVTNPAALQWGRGLPSAETSSNSKRSIWAPARFNGAADFHPRKPQCLDRPLVESGASMGPRTSIRGNHPCGQRAAGCENAFSAACYG